MRNRLEATFGKKEAKRAQGLMNDQAALAQELERNSQRPSTSQGRGNFAEFLSSHPEYAPRDVEKNLPPEIMQWNLDEHSGGGLRPSPAFGPEKIPSSIQHHLNPWDIKTGPKRPIEQWYLNPWGFA